MDNEKDELPLLALQDALGFATDSVEEYEIKFRSHRFDFDGSEPEKGKTLLINLVEKMQNTDFIWIVLEYFADPNIKDKEFGRTALHYACQANQKGAIIALMLFGAHTDISDNTEAKAFDLIKTINKEDLEK